MDTALPDGTDGDAPNPDAAPREGGEGRRRGRGRDRNRRERGEEGSVDNVQPQGAVAAEGLIQEGALADQARSEAQAPIEAPAYASPAPDGAPVPTETPAYPYQQRTEPAAPVVPAVPPARTASPEVAVPVAAAAAPVAAVEEFVLPLDRLQAVAESAGLQWVNSDVEKIRAVQAAMAAEPKPVHVPRERKPVPPADEGPLVLVETRKDLTQIKLPFESAQGSQPQA